MIDTTKLVDLTARVVEIATLTSENLGDDVEVRIGEAIVVCEVHVGSAMRVNVYGTDQRFYMTEALIAEGQRTLNDARAATGGAA